MEGLKGTRTLAIAQEIGLDRHQTLLDQFLNEPQRLHEQRQQKLQELQTFERSEWQMAKDALEVEKARLFLIINETPSDNGKAAAAAEALRVANNALAQAKEKLETARARLLLQVLGETTPDGKPKYANDKQREAALLVAQDDDHNYAVALEEYRIADEAASKAKAEADAKAPKPKFSNAEAREAAMVQMQLNDPDYMAALRRFRQADATLANLRGEADAMQQEIANVSSKLWGLRELIKGDAAVLMAVATLDGPKLPMSIPITLPDGALVVRLQAPESLPDIHLVDIGKAAA